MNRSHKSFNVNECKILTSILLKSLHSQDLDKVKQAAKRFQQLPEFAKLSIDEMKSQVKRKHALAVIAFEKRFKSWADLKCQLAFIRGGFLNEWFANYSEAKIYLRLHGGFLLPYQNQFFICDANYIKNLGFNPDDPDWQLIGYDWANPHHRQAWQRLYRKWILIQKNSQE
ncbi:hypothetical protein [Legionella brunensis]|uniref:Uncharacterized protein n=1 Tax=Legionella brunensis TaxID=29422 RepID=A0A0W0SKJ3_9GAMM|nr:hypothetical protein [Legionella brunensis]KTC83835.1 hypothetical protein Lbru_1658 [Legionella brunensis]